MKATPFISQAIKDSGVVEFVAENIGKVRAERFGEELFFNLSYFTKVCFKNLDTLYTLKCS